jgi:hypothetical protein
MSLNHAQSAEFRSASHAVAGALSIPAVRARFPGAEVPADSVEAETVCAGLPSELLPFLLEKQQSTWDVYAFDLSAPEAQRILVWNDHAFVAEWPTFDAFIRWMHGT